MTARILAALLSAALLGAMSVEFESSTDATLFYVVAACFGLSVDTWSQRLRRATLLGLVDEWEANQKVAR